MSCREVVIDRRGVARNSREERHAFFSPPPSGRCTDGVTLAADRSRIRCDSRNNVSNFTPAGARHRGNTTTVTANPRARRAVAALFVLAAAWTCLFAAPHARGADIAWPEYGGDAGGRRYSE